MVGVFQWQAELRSWLLPSTWKFHQFPGLHPQTVINPSRRDEAKHAREKSPTMSLFKSRGVFASLCLWTFLFLSVNAKTRKKDETRSMNDIYRGRCASRCLSLHSTRIATLSKRSQVEVRPKQAREHAAVFME